MKSKLPPTSCIRLHVLLFSEDLQDLRPDVWNSLMMEVLSQAMIKEKKIYINVYKSWVAAFYVYSNMSLKSRSSEDIRLGSARRWHFTEVSTAGRRGPAKSKGHSFSQVQNTTSYCIPGYKNRLNKHVSSVCFGILVIFNFLMDRKELSSAHAELGWNEILQNPHMKENCTTQAVNNKDFSEKYWSFFKAPL